MKGKLIAIEGIDGSGKNTQTTNIVHYIKAQSIKCAKISFPSYDETFFGKEVGHYLNGAFGELDQIHPKLTAILFAGDRFERRSEIQDMLADGYVLIMDRYVPSNIVHQAAKLKGTARNDLALWIEELEYAVFGMPKPDLVVFLDVPPKTSQGLVLAKAERSYTNKKQDLHEINQDYLKSVYNYFHEQASQNSWNRIDCVKNGMIRSQDSIFEDIRNILNLILN